MAKITNQYLRYLLVVLGSVDLKGHLSAPQVSRRVSLKWKAVQRAKVGVVHESSDQDLVLLHSCREEADERGSR